MMKSECSYSPDGRHRIDPDISLRTRKRRHEVDLDIEVPITKITVTVWCALCGIEGTVKITPRRVDWSE